MKFTLEWLLTHIVPAEFADNASALTAGQHEADPKDASGEEQGHKHGDHLRRDWRAVNVPLLAETLTKLGLEVESIDDNATRFAAFSTAKVIEALPHPHADRLRVCRVAVYDHPIQSKPDDHGDRGARGDRDHHDHHDHSGSGTAEHDQAGMTHFYREVQVVCGAPNARTDMIGVFAPAGTFIPGTDVHLKPSTIRGVESHGMLCSERELLISDDHDGIIDLADDTPLGVNYAAYKGLDDVVIELGITPNRGDCLSVRGIARDLAAVGWGQLVPLADIDPQCQSPLPAADAGGDPAMAQSTSATEGSVASELRVPPSLDHAEPSPVGWAITPHTPCMAVYGCYLRGVVNQPSPPWLARRLRAIGQPVISALVDVTNYITYDLGRPLHVFDADTLHGKVLTIHRANQLDTSVGSISVVANETDTNAGDTSVVVNEPGTNAGDTSAGDTSAADTSAGDAMHFAALDNRDYAISGEDMVISDDRRAQGITQSLAGVMGGRESGCTLATTNVFIEAALFEAVAVARAGRKHNIHSSARHRFERGVDTDSLEWGMRRAVQMVQDLCGGSPSRIERVFNPDYCQATAEHTPPVMSTNPNLRHIALDARKFRSLGGVDLPSTLSELPREVTILRALGFAVESSGQESLSNGDARGADATAPRRFVVSPPSWRHDITSEACLIEEVLRVYGYDNIVPVADPTIGATADDLAAIRRVLQAREDAPICPRAGDGGSATPAAGTSAPQMPTGDAGATKKGKNKSSGKGKKGKGDPTTTGTGDDGIATIDTRRHAVLRAKQELAQRGLFESVTNTFTDPTLIDAIGLAPANAQVRLQNPISEALGVMRPSLLVNLVGQAAMNMRAGYDSVSLFEVGPVFDARTPQHPATHIAMVRGGLAHRKHWNQDEQRFDPTHIHEDIRAVLTALGAPLANVRVDQSTIPLGFHPTRSATLRIGQFAVGGFGSLHPQWAALLDVKVRRATFAMEAGYIILDQLPNLRPPAQQGIDLAHVEPVDLLHRHFSFHVPIDRPVDDLRRELLRADKATIRTVAVLDAMVLADPVAGSDNEQAADQAAAPIRSVTFSVGYQLTGDADASLVYKNLETAVVTAAEKWGAVFPHTHLLQTTRESVTPGQPDMPTS